MTQIECDEAMMSLIHHNMQLGKMVTLVGQLFENVSPQVSARLYPVWAEAYRSALQDMQNAYNLGVTEERKKKRLKFGAPIPSLPTSTNPNPTDYAIGLASLESTATNPSTLP